MYKLDKVLRLAGIWICGLYKTCSLPAVLVANGWLPSKILIKKEIMTYISKYYQKYNSLPFDINTNEVYNKKITKYTSIKEIMQLELTDWLYHHNIQDLCFNRNKINIDNYYKQLWITEWSNDHRSRTFFNFFSQTIHTNQLIWLICQDRKIVSIVLQILT